MSRPKRIHKCRSCGVEFTWETIDKSVRQVNLNGSVHYCGKPAGLPVNRETTQPTVEASTPKVSIPDVINVNPMPELPTINTENKPEAGKPLYDLVRPYVLEDIVTANNAMGSKLTTAINTALGEHVKAVDSLVNEAIKSAQIVTHEVTITRPDGATVKLTDCHKQFSDLMESLALGENVYLVGPAGTGKTTAGKHAADALALKFFPISVGPQTSKSDFFGFTDVQGRPIWTVVREAYVNGGVLLIDEMDAAGAGPLTYMNAILANDYAVFPADVNDVNKVTVERKHKDFYCIAAGNTYGHGGNRMYQGRNQLDAATLDRFIGIDWDYDTDLEKRIATGYNRFYTYLLTLRSKSEEMKIKAVFGTRKLIRGVKALKAGWDIEKINERIVFFGMSNDDVSKLKNNVSY